MLRYFSLGFTVGETDRIVSLKFRCKGHTIRYVYISSLNKNLSGAEKSKALIFSTFSAFCKLSAARTSNLLMHT